VITVLGAMILAIMQLKGGTTALRRGGTLVPRRLDDGPMLGAATADGIADPLVAYWSLESGQTVKRVAALQADTGKVLWTTDPVESSSGERTKLAAVGSALLANKLALLDAYDLRTGKHLWQKNLPERLDRVCDNGREGAALLTRDKQVYALELTTGELTPKGKVRAERPPYRAEVVAKARGGIRKFYDETIDEWTRQTPCFPASSPESGNGNVKLDEPARSAEDMVVREVWRERERDTRLVLGHKYPGTGVPMIAAVDADDKPLWKAEVPSKNPLDAKEGAPAAFTIGGGRVVVGYARATGDHFIVSVWALQTGQRYWEIAIHAKDTQGASFAINDREVFVRIGSALHAFALVDGRALWSFGEDQD